MNLQIISWFQKIFWVLGWSILLLAFASVAGHVYYYFQSAPGLLPKQDFYFLKQSQVLFSYLGQAFFAFLVSSVFGMIFHRAPVKLGQTEAFLKLTCIGFIGEGVFGLISWVQLAMMTLPNFEASTRLGLISILGFLLSVSPYIFTFVYAITIYVLYRHFSKMIKFESEVV